jgi:hypothetical protein
MFDNNTICNTILVNMGGGGILCLRQVGIRVEIYMYTVTAMRLCDVMYVNIYSVRTYIFDITTYLYSFYDYSSLVTLQYSAVLCH